MIERRRFGIVALALSVLALASLAGRAEEQPAVANFTVADLAGKPWSLHDHTGKKAIVLVFVSAECPMSNAYLADLAELARVYEPRGVFLAAINANPSETSAQIAAHAKEYRIPFPVLRDEHQAAARALKARVNPEAFVLDGGFHVRYRGRIDDGYTARLQKSNRVTRRDLKAALDEILAGKPVSTPVTEAFGCAILPVRPAATVSAESAVTYHRDVAPILQKHCQSCHRPGDVGPFPLMTYVQAVKWADDIVAFTQNRKMPPWKPVGSHGMFENERGLSEQEAATLARWVDSGTPEGDPREAPPPRKFVEGWYLGEPDLVLEVPEDMHIGPNGRDLFRVFVLPTNLTEDKYVAAFEIRPGNRRVVHHTLNFIDTTGQGRKLEQEWRQAARDQGQEDHGPGYSVSMGVGFLPRGAVGGWAPGQVPKFLPDGVGYYLPKGSDIVLQVHYHRTGRAEQDRIRMGLYFAKKPVTERFQAMVLPGRFLFIPAGNDNYKVQGTIYVKQDVTLYSVMPHMHLLGKQIQAVMTLPDGTRRNLVNIQDWDYNWQETYYLKEPIKVPAGTRFDVTAVYDNSDKNPLNPNHPPLPVRLGEQTTNEMCFVFLGATSNKPGRIQIGTTPPASATAPGGE